MSQAENAQPVLEISEVMVLCELVDSPSEITVDGRLDDDVESRFANIDKAGGCFPTSHESIFRKESRT